MLTGIHPRAEVSKLGPAGQPFLYIKFYWHTAMLICLYTVTCGWFLATMGEVTSCDRVYKDHNV